MIISHRYKYIFLKTSKTAGTSIEIALSKHCGPEDIITSIDEQDEIIRAGFGYRGPQNNLVPIREWRFRDVFRFIRNRPRREKYVHHIRAKEIRKLIGEKIWNSYYKFCFERNPWERFISYYYNMHPEVPRPSMSEFLDHGINRLKQNGIDVYTIDGTISVDKVCIFERLSEDLDDVRKCVGIPEPLNLPRAKTNFRKDKREYTEILNPEQIEAIRTAFSWEIRRFHYDAVDS